MTGTRRAVDTPFVLFYNNDEGVAPSATVNDFVVGVVIVALATASMVAGRRARSQPEA